MARHVWRSLAGCAVAALLAGCNKPEAKSVAEPPSAPPPPVVTTNSIEPVQPAHPESPRLPEMVATIRGASEIPVKAPQAGYLVRQVYRDGATVAAGDVLFLLDPRNSHPDVSPESVKNVAMVKVIASSPGVAAHALHGPGDHVEAGDDLTDLAQIDDVIAESTVSDAVARNFQGYLNSSGRASQPAIELILPDGSIYPTHGVIANVVISGNVNTMQIDFSNPGHVLQPGEFVRVRSSAAEEFVAPASPASR